MPGYRNREHPHPPPGMCLGMFLSSRCPYGQLLDVLGSEQEYLLTTQVGAEYGEGGSHRHIHPPGAGEGAEHAHRLGGPLYGSYLSQWVKQISAEGLGPGTSCCVGVLTPDEG